MPSRYFSRTIKNQKGQGMIEYLILVALMAVASIGIMRSLNHVVNARFANVIYSLQGSQKKAKTETLSEKEFSKKDLSNFMNGAASKNSN